MSQAIYNLGAFEFLISLYEHLNTALPAIGEVSSAVDEEAKLVQSLSPLRKGSKLIFREGAFMSRFITPQIHRFLMNHEKLDESSARDAIISENSIDRKRGYANAIARTKYPLAHPFGKSIGSSAADIVARWYGADQALSTKHPDLCLTHPHRILMEAKYLRKPTTTSGARAALVKAIYEALFYLGLAPKKESVPPWQYEFAVALIYDGTPDAAVVQAWKELRSEIRDGIWNAANIFVMPLRALEIDA